MNIFVVDEDPAKAAMDLCNKHIVKMPLETAQMLCTAISQLENVATPNKPTHKNHPCNIWVRESCENFEWLYIHGIGLCEAYTKEYKKRHKSQDVIEWAWKNKPTFKLKQLTKHPLCMPDQYKSGDVVSSYRKFYIGDKSKFAKWKERAKPDWFVL